MLESRTKTVLLIGSIQKLFQKAVLKGVTYLVHGEERVPLLEELVEVIRHLILRLGVFLAVRKACRKTLEHS